MESRRARRLVATMGALALVVGGSVALLAAPAGAAGPFTVSNTNNSGSGSLRQAFADAAVAGGEIDVTAGLGTIVLTSGPISYVGNGDVSMVGNGVTVDGNGGDGVVHKTGGTGALSIDGTTIIGGNATTGDVIGAVAVEGTGDVNVSNCAFTGNHQTSSVVGSDVGALVLSSRESESLTVTNCTFTENVSTATMIGADIAGAIDWDADGDSATITNSRFSGNSATAVSNAVVAGAIDSEGGPLTISGSSIDGNHATATNGQADVGAVVSEGGDLVVQYTSITNNSSSGAAVSINIGAAMNNEGGPETLVNVTASNNTSTITEVQAGAEGAGTGVGRNSRVHSEAVNNVSAAGWINYGGEGSLVYVTMNHNSGASNAAIYNAGNYLNGGGQVTMFGTAIGDPQSGPNCTLFPGNTAFVSNGYNAEDDAGATCGFAASTNDKVGSPLGLGTLADNGGPGLTQVPQTGSVLLDAIPPAACQADGAAGVTTDERGVTRPQGPGCEIGAVEVELVTPPAPSPALVIAPKFTG